MHRVLVKTYYKITISQKKLLQSIGKELKAQTDIAKDQEKLFKDQMNINNKKIEEDESDEARID